MSTDDPRTLLHDAATGPVAPLDHDELRRRARGRTRSKWAAAGMAVLAAVVGVGGLVANLQGPPTIDVVDTPGGTVGPGEPLPVEPERVPTAILSYSIAGDDSLGVAVDSCGGQPQVRTIEETDEEVRLEVVANNPTGGIRWMCRDSVVMDLERPLGDRTLVDLTTGQEISADEVTASQLEGLPEFPVTLDLPPVGEVAASHVGERPVFVVHRDTGDVLVLDAISPHRAGTELPKVVAFCNQPWRFETRDQDTAVETPGTFDDLWHASRFALDGAYLGGPAPTGLARYRVLSVDADTVEIGPPGEAPEREVGPFEDVLGPRSSINGRDLGGPICTSAFDQTRDTSTPGDQADVVWHDAEYPDRWLYPFHTAGGQATPDENLEPLVEGEQPTSQQPTDGTSVEAVLIILAFVAAIAALAVYLRRREAEGSLDAGPSSVSRRGLRRFFDFGPGGWSKDGKNQAPQD